MTTKTPVVERSDEVSLRADVQRRADALAAQLAARLGLCSLDELRVVDVLMSRLELGRDRYGYLDLAKHRDWAREEAEERVDAEFYRACAVLVVRDERTAAIERDLTHEIVAGPVEAGLRELADITAKFDTGGTEP